MRKKIVYSIFIIFALTIICGATTSLGALPTEAEAQALLDQIPNEITVNYKETEYEKANDLVYEKAEEILGQDIYWESSLYMGYYGEDTLDIKKAWVRIYLDEYWETYVEKDIKITYTNSQDYNEADKLFVEEKTAGINFHRRWDYNIYSADNIEDTQDKSDFSWNELIGTDDIYIMEGLAGIGGTEFETREWNILFFFKNDVFYKAVECSKADTGKIIIPDNIEETDEAYINYAKPIIEEMACYDYEYEDEYDGVTYRHVQTIKNIERRYDDFIQYEITFECKDFENGVLIETSGYSTTVLIAKEGEYRAKLNPFLQDVEITNKADKEYVKGTMKITQVHVGYDISIDEEYPPEIVLIDNSGNEYKTTVTRSENNIYYFEIELDKLALGKKYIIQARVTDPGNKYPSNNINAAMLGNSINVSNDTINIKSTIENSYVKLNIAEIGSEIIDLGDINADGDINARDAKLAIQHFTGKIVLTDDQIARGDVYVDGEINARDAKLIIQFFTGKISEF